MKKIAQFICLLVIAVTVFLPCAVPTSGVIVFIATCGLFLLSLLDGKLSLLSAFTAAFAYMIPPEAVLFADVLDVAWGASHVLSGWRVLCLAFVAVNLGFLLFRKPLKADERVPFPRCASNSPRAKKVFFGLTVFLVLIFSPMIVYGLTTGRGSSSLYNSEDGGGLLFGIGLLGYFLHATIYAVCGFWGYYFARERRGAASFLKTLLFSSPLFLIGVASGTRYSLCFMLASALLPWIYRLSAKKLKWCAVGGLFLIVVFSAMKNSRYRGFDITAWQDSEQATGTIVERVLAKGSPEGLLRNMAMIDLWATTHPHTHGKSIGFLGIFWIPRAIWVEKPTQLDHWLIREYENGFGSGYSTASSFCGELFMDFGYACLVVCFLLGVFMAKADRFIERKLVVGGYFPTAMAGVVFGWAFFMTRSFLTASYAPILGLPVVWALSRFVLKERMARLITPPPFPCATDFAGALWKFVFAAKRRLRRNEPAGKIFSGFAHGRNFAAETGGAA